MQFKQDGALLFVPDGATDALQRTTHMGIGAHQDDLEIMAIDGILKCFKREDSWFTGVVVTDGSSSSRTGLYANYTDDDMRLVRVREQRKAAVVGEYSALALLDYPSAAVKDAANTDVVADLVTLLQVAQPGVVYTHNLADKHSTHIGVAVKTIQAIRQLAPEARPGQVYGCEVWRDLDWMVDSDKVAFDTSDQQGLQTALVGLFDSQISGGKRYDLATMGRRRAHATYHEAHESDAATGLVFAMDLTPMIQDDNLDIAGYVADYIQRFADDVSARIGSVS